MRVGQLGFGKTGKAVASVLLDSRKCELQWVMRKSHKLEHRSVPEFLGIESNEPGLIYSIDEFDAAYLLDAHPVDIIVDFSSCDGLYYYAEEAKKRGIAIITAISEYPKHAEQHLLDLARHIRIVHSPNITLGINFLIVAAKVLQKIAPSIDIEIIEQHFKSKPELSGTARIIANGLGVEHDQIKSIRAGGIIGVHEILFGFPYQTVRLKHESISREAFGNGVLFAIEHLPECTSGLFNMEDLLIPHFSVAQTILDRSILPPWPH